MAMPCREVSMCWGESERDWNGASQLGRQPTLDASGGLVDGGS